VLFVIAALYVFFVLRLQLSPILKLGIAIAAALVGFYLPALHLNNRTGRRQHSIRRAWPDALDLMLICVESGMAVENAFRKVSEEIVTQSIELAEELALTTAELSYLADRRMAYDNLSRRTGLDGVKGVVTALVQSEKYGTPVGQTLRLFAQEQRHARLTEAEKKAAQLPPKLTVPMILFFLPVLFAVILTPPSSRYRVFTRRIFR
jgi:tight adherence protein C